MSKRNMLRKAKEVLRKNGWIKGQYWDMDTGRYCAIGALREAKNLIASEHNPPLYSPAWSTWWSQVERDYNEAEELLLRTVNELYGDRARVAYDEACNPHPLGTQVKFPYVQMFNDLDNTKEEEIMHAFSHAADEWDLTHEEKE